MNKIMIVAAHPDDDILGCGGIMQKYSKSGSIIKVIFIGEGSSCRFEKPDSKDALKEIEKRNEDGRNALNFLGIEKYEFYNLPCGRLDQVPQIEINKILEKEISDFKPDSVFTHSKCDANNDHKIIFESTIVATRPNSKFTVEKLYSYEVLSSSEWNFGSTFAPNFFEQLSKENIEKKIQAMQFYDSELQPFPHPRSEEGISTLASFRGIQSGFKYAEAFRLIRKIQK